MPSDGYHFTGWTGDYTGTDNPLLISKVSSNMNITANFDVNTAGQCTVTFTADSGGTINGVASQYISAGGDCSPVTAAPFVGYSFSAWTGDHTGTENPLTITGVTKNMIIDSNFQTQTFTVTFTAGSGGTPTGQTTQTVPYGGNSSPVGAIPNDGFYFTGWSGDYTGRANPLIITGVTKDMNMTANFNSVPEGHYVVNFTSAGNGWVSGGISQLVVSGGQTNPVTAVPDYGYHFIGWTGDHIGNENPLTVQNISANMTITANFAANDPGTFTVTFVAIENGSISGIVSQLVKEGSDCSQVTAVPDTGFSFHSWIGDYEGTVNPLTIQNVTDNMVIYAVFGIPDFQLACGMYLCLLPGQISGFTDKNFTKPPSTKAIYDDPVTGKKTQKAPMKTLNKITAKVTAEFADCEWNKAVKLYNQKLWDKKKTCLENFRDIYVGTNEMVPLSCTKVLVSVNKLKDVETVQAAVLQYPYISRMMDSYGAVIGTAKRAEIIYVEGVFFGKNSPKVWLEYPAYEKDGTTVKAIKTLNVKVLKPYVYVNYKNQAGKSCMDICSGLSRVGIIMPKKWPKNWNHGIPHNIVIDNKVGRATIEFKTAE